MWTKIRGIARFPCDNTALVVYRFMSCNFTSCSFRSFSSVIFISCIFIQPACSTQHPQQHKRIKYEDIDFSRQWAVSVFFLFSKFCASVDLKVYELIDFASLQYTWSTVGLNAAAGFIHCIIYYRMGLLSYLRLSVKLHNTSQTAFQFHSL